MNLIHPFCNCRRGKERERKRQRRVKPKHNSQIFWSNLVKMEGNSTRMIEGNEFQKFCARGLPSKTGMKFYIEFFSFTK